uniref:EF-hand domain-containing protein n=2 Tax=Macrostomum lignano TaxID=282301 RepID=A0A1I8GLS4_9PLAT
MRSLGFAPHIDEARKYLAEGKASTGELDFPQFLEILHRHRRAENAERDMMEALKLYDPQGRGTVPVSELRRVLCNQGERLSAREFEGLLREAGVAQSGSVNYRQVVKTLLTPLPDY